MIVSPVLPSCERAVSGCHSRAACAATQPAHGWSWFFDRMISFVSGRSRDREGAVDIRIFRAVDDLRHSGVKGAKSHGQDTRRRLGWRQCELRARAMRPRTSLSRDSAGGRSLAGHSLRYSPSSRRAPSRSPPAKRSLADRNNALGMRVAAREKWFNASARCTCRATSESRPAGSAPGRTTGLWPAPAARFGPPRPFD